MNGNSGFARLSGTFWFQDSTLFRILARLKKTDLKNSALSTVLDLQLVKEEIVSNHPFSFGVRVKMRFNAAR